MNFIATNLIISLLFFTTIIGIGIFIQVKLSRSKNKYLGLIMPIISFLLSLMVVLSINAIYLLTPLGNEAVEATGELGNSINYLAIFFTFLLSNIPTAILGGIYLSERNKIDVKKSIEKMKINDL